jgi:hypothetical protein
MKKLFLITSLLLLTFCKAFSQIKSWPFIVSVFGNQNVYKTKTGLKLQKVYNLNNNRAITDTTKFILTPTNNYPFIKYKIVEEGDNPYIRILPNVYFVINSSGDTIIVADTNNHIGDDPTDFYFQMVDDPTPNNHYMASQSIIGMPLTMPVKFRKLHGQTNLELNLTLGYAFGYRIKLGNNPYRKKYISIIPFALSINEDKYFYKISEQEDSEQEEAVSLTYYACGLAYEYYNFNVGFFTGWDRMFSNQKNWVYQNHNWMSVGIGYKFGGDE